jgi:beta-N-acetylhexosaminidase
MLKKVCVMLVCGAVMANVYGQKLFDRHNKALQTRWVDSVFSSMTFDERLGQLFMVAAYSNRDEKHYTQIEQLIKKNHIGGLIFFQGGPMRQAQLTNRFQNAARVPLLIAIDGEWGLGMRLDSTISYPKQITLGAISDNRYIYNMGAEIARQMKLMGIHINFAPVVDVNSNPANPVIGFRSFGENKYNVAAKGVAYMRGMQDNGLMANAKHFPGHGDTDTDSHYTLPLLKHNRARLDSLELFPFKELIRDSILSIMVAHIHIPSIDSTRNLATTLSHKAVTGLLKNEMQFEGLIFTDALNMKGVSKFYEPGQVDLIALLAGNDVLLFAENVPVAIDYIKKAIKNEQITAAEIDQRVKKILKAKYWAGLHEQKLVNTDNLVLNLNNPDAHLVKQKLFEQAITVVENEKDLVPITILDTASFASLSIGSESKTIFQYILSKYAPIQHFNIGPKEARTANKQAELLNQLQNFKYVVVGVHGLRSFPANNYGVNQSDIKFLLDLQKRTNVIVVVFGNPYTLKFFEGFNNLICAYEDNEVAQRVVPQVVFGALPSKGKLPVTASAKYKAGTGIETNYLGRLGYTLPEDVGMMSSILAKIDQIAEDAISSGATPGCQVLVAKKGKIIFEKGYGYLTYEKIDPVTDETVYDVASLTKTAATLQSIMFLEGKGKLDLDKKASYYLPEMRTTNKRNLGLRDILTHQAGLIPFIPYWRYTVDAFGVLPAFYHTLSDSIFNGEVAKGLYGTRTLTDSLWKWTLDSDLRAKPKRGSYDYRYSDLGFFILYQLAETLLNQNLSEFLEQNFYKPLGLPSLGFRPLCRMPESLIAPTEDDQYFRKQLIRGTVHDPGAAMRGGIAGHAGLFSNAHDLAKLFQMNLQDGYYGGTRYLEPGVVEKFTRKQFATNRRGLGWDKPSVGESFQVTSRFASHKTYGHTGFTGTAAWIDPEFDLIYIFLSNRIYPDAGNIKLIKSNVRTRIHDVVYEAMWEYQKYNLP